MAITDSTLIHSAQNMVNKNTMIPVESLSSPEIKEGAELAEMALEARQFLQWHLWCKTVLHSYLDRGWAGILAVFYFEIETNTPVADNILWVVVGDLPPAYMDIVNCPDGATAIEGYVCAMQEWVDQVKAGNSVEDCIPVYERNSFVRIKATREYAQMLESRLEFIRSKILSDYEEELME